MKPVITEAYRAEQATLHATGKYGTTGSKFGPLVAAIVRSSGAGSLLDYGCGSRRSLLETLVLPPDVVYEGYDPAVPAYAEPPLPAELVCCIDVLEHIEPALLDNVLDHLGELCDPFGLFSVHTGPAVKVLSDGRNAHLTQQPYAWWRSHLEKRFDLLDQKEIPNGFVVLVRGRQAQAEPGHAHLKIPLASTPVPAAQPAGPAKPAGPPQQRIEHAGISMNFSTPNDVTAWRVKTLFDKEPHTIHWLEQMPAGSVLLDVGANVGMYSIFAAAVRGVTVAAFEPESQNYALLNTNIAINGLSDRVAAYPLALSDRMQLDKLFLSQFSAGGSCHSFGAEVGFDLKPRAAGFTQGAFSATVDQLVDSGALAVPDFIKIDVDGIEHKVIAGCMRTLENPKVRSILVELNTHLAEHRQAVDQLLAIGFRYEEAQVNQALRSAGAFEGVGEFIFTRAAQADPSAVSFTHVSALRVPTTAGSRAVLDHVLAQLHRSPVEQAPFPHLVIDDIFPPAYYQAMQAAFPALDQMEAISETGRVSKGAYQERAVLLFNDAHFARLTQAQRQFWTDFTSWMYGDFFVNAFLQKFQSALGDRLERILAADPVLKVRSDALLVHDATNYAIGPHTDGPHRLVSFLFYLPEDDGMSELGTSLYRPKDPDFTCWSGLHHPFEGFERVKTIPFLPNRLVVFPKTAQCFHGVERIARAGVQRRLVINNLRLMNPVTH